MAAMYEEMRCGWCDTWVCAVCVPRHGEREHRLFGARGAALAVPGSRNVYECPGCERPLELSPAMRCCCGERRHELWVPWVPGYGVTDMEEGRAAIAARGSAAEDVRRREDGPPAEGESPMPRSVWMEVQDGAERLAARAHAEQWVAAGVAELLMGEDVLAGDSQLLQREAARKQRREIIVVSSDGE